MCDCWTAAASIGVINTYECEQDSDCQCKSGFYGNGKICVPCKKCSPQATALVISQNSNVSCPMMGATEDWTTCTCNLGYYGDGVSCDPCKICDQHAVTSGICSSGSTADVVTCECFAGYFGVGTTCTPCSVGSYSSQTGKFLIIFAISTAQNVLIHERCVQG